jgi:hypothetical protein
MKSNEWHDSVDLARMSTLMHIYLFSHLHRERLQYSGWPLNRQFDVGCDCSISCSTTSYGEWLHSRSPSLLMKSGNAKACGLVLVAPHAGWCTISFLTTSNEDLLLVIHPGKCWFPPALLSRKLTISSCSWTQFYLVAVVCLGCVPFVLFIVCLPWLLPPPLAHA